MVVPSKPAVLPGSRGGPPLVSQAYRVKGDALSLLSYNCKCQYIAAARILARENLAGITVGVSTGHAQAQPTPTAL